MQQTTWRLGRQARRRHRRALLREQQRDAQRAVASEAGACHLTAGPRGSRSLRWPCGGAPVPAGLDGQRLSLLGECRCAVDGFACPIEFLIANPAVGGRGSLPRHDRHERGNNGRPTIAFRSDRRQSNSIRTFVRRRTCCAVARNGLRSLTARATRCRPWCCAGSRTGTTSSMGITESRSREHCGIGTSTHG
jgi:hypothetical protein